MAELIRNDMFLISKQQNNNFVLDLLKIKSHGLKHAICALISVIASTPQGVAYLVEKGMSICEEVINILKD